MGVAAEDHKVVGTDRVQAEEPAIVPPGEDAEREVAGKRTALERAAEFEHSCRDSGRGAEWPQ